MHFSIATTKATRNNKKNGALFFYLLEELLSLPRSSSVDVILFCCLRGGRAGTGQKHAVSIIFCDKTKVSNLLTESKLSSFLFPKKNEGPKSCWASERGATVPLAAAATAVLLGVMMITHFKEGPKKGDKDLFLRTL